MHCQNNTMWAAPTLHGTGVFRRKRHSGWNPQHKGRNHSPETVTSIARPPKERLFDLGSDMYLLD
jgi:hypothetical protein